MKRSGVKAVKRFTCIASTLIIAHLGSNYLAKSKNLEYERRNCSNEKF